MKKIMYAVACLTLIGTVFVLQYLPERIPMHYDMAGNIDRWGSRNESLIFPIIILAMVLFWQLFISYFEKKADRAADEKTAAEARSNARVMTIAGLATTVMFAVMHVFILYGSWKEAVSGAKTQAVDIGKVAVILMGILYIVLGNFMTKTRANRLIGARVKWSLYNDRTWSRTNRFGAVALIGTGLLTVLLAVLVKNSLAAVLASLGLLLLAVIAIVLYAYRVYRQELAAEKGDA